MLLYEKINERLKQAMREKDTQVANSLRVIKTRASEYLVQERLPRDTVSDEVMVIVLSSYKKSLQKAIEQLSGGGEKADNLIAEYSAEIKLCEQYLPDESESVAQLDLIVTRVIKEHGATDEKQVGRIMGHIMKNNSGLEGKLVKELVLKKLRG